MKKEEDEGLDNGDDVNHYDNDSDNAEWDGMYVDDERVLGSDQDENTNGGRDEDGKCAEISGGEFEGEDKDGGEVVFEGEVKDGDEVENGGEVKKEVNDGRGLSRGKGTKRKLNATQDDEPATKVKKTKKDGSGAHQGVTQSAKKVVPKRKSTQKKV